LDAGLTLVDDSGEAVASAPDTGGDVEQGGGMSVSDGVGVGDAPGGGLVGSTDTSIAEDIPATSDDSGAPMAESGVHEEPMGLVTQSSESSPEPGVSQSKEDRVYEELRSSLSAEGERWVRGLGGYETPRGFPVKGNASSRLYHMPGGRSYAVTMPEICFASADDARAGGFRPRSGDPTELDMSLVQEVELPERFGIRASDLDESAAESEPVQAELDSVQSMDGPGWVKSDGSRDCPPDYPIKGNGSSRIYHVPGGGSYDATVPELCFATPDDAESAGFRAART
jgi:hypothetical protein